MNFIKTNNPKHPRVNLNKMSYFYPVDYSSNDWRITFSGEKSEKTWGFSTGKERDEILVKLDSAANSQDISLIVKL